MSLYFCEHSWVLNKTKEGRSAIHHCLLRFLGSGIVFVEAEQVEKPVLQDTYSTKGSKLAHLLTYDVMYVTSLVQRLDAGVKQ